MYLYKCILLITRAGRSLMLNIAINLVHPNNSCGLCYLLITTTKVNIELIRYFIIFVSCKVQMSHYIIYVPKTEISDKSFLFQQWFSGVSIWKHSSRHSPRSWLFSLCVQKPSSLLQVLLFSLFISHNNVLKDHIFA